MAYEHVIDKLTLGGLARIELAWVLTCIEFIQGLAYIRLGLGLTTCTMFALEGFEQLEHENESFIAQQVDVRDVFRRLGTRFFLGLSLGGYIPYIYLGIPKGYIQLGVQLRSSLSSFFRPARTLSF